ncbi:MAG: cytochrome, partial [Sphingomonas bacterium]|nr:cytochrome [Sphingomonas bacterium]
PLISRAERPRPLPNSITEAVLAKKGGTSPRETALADAH